MIKKKHSDSQGKSIPYIFSAVVAVAGSLLLNQMVVLLSASLSRESDQDSMFETGASCVAVMMLIVSVYRYLFKTTGLNRCEEVG